MLKIGKNLHRTLKDLLKFQSHIVCISVGGKLNDKQFPDKSKETSPNKSHVEEFSISRWRAAMITKQECMFQRSKVALKADTILQSHTNTED